MPLVTTAEIVRTAVRDRVAAVAFNVFTLEQAEAVAAGAERAEAPVIAQVSANAVAFRGSLAPLAAALSSIAASSSTAIALHLDHALSLDLCREAAAAGFSSVMFDAANRSYERNVEATRAVAEWAHGEGLWLEAELGEIGGKEGSSGGELTDPEEASDYVAATGTDLLAVAVGSRHKMLGATAHLDLERLAALREAVPVPLVLHGSSGVADEHLREAVEHGIVKINIGTRLLQRYTEQIRLALVADGALVDPRPYLTTARNAMSAEVEAVLLTLSPHSSAD